MNINVNVDEITLDTIVGDVYAYDSDTGEWGHRNQTIADLVAVAIVDGLHADHDSWNTLGTRFREIRTELIRDMIRPQLEQALAEPFRRTNDYGEPTGQPVTLRELVVKEAQRALTAPVDTYNRDKGSFVDQLVRTEVRNAFAAEVADALKQARAAVAGEIGKQVASAAIAAMKAK